MRPIRRVLGLLAVSALVLGLNAPGAGAEGAPGGGQIIGGGVVDATTVPWTVAILDAAVANAYQAQFCGGSLIDDEWVLTAAHCVNGTAPSSIDVTWGITDLNAVNAGDRHAISQILVNPQYNANASTSDVALLRLSTPAVGATTIAYNPNPTVPALAQALDTYGWGNTLYPGTSYPNLLHGVTLEDRAGPVGACGSYGSSYISDHMVCAGVAGGGKDACQGDSGGPLVATTGGGQHLLVGVTSWGNGCALASYPGIWSRVSSYADWINQQVTGNTTPRVHVGDATLMEGDSGNRTAFFSVSISPAPTASVGVPYATSPVSAAAGADYVTKTSTLTFSAGQVSKVISVPVKSDALSESTETFRVLLGTPTGLTGATLVNLWGTGTILDDDATAGTRAAIGDASIREGDDGTGSMLMKVQVSLTQAAGATVSIPYSTVTGSASTRDFTPKSGSLVFSATAKTKTLSLVVAREWIPEANDTFTVVLGAPTGPATVTRGTGTFTILNDD